MMDIEIIIQIKNKYKNVLIFFYNKQNIIRTIKE